MSHTEIPNIVTLDASRVVVQLVLPTNSLVDTVLELTGGLAYYVVINSSKRKKEVVAFDTLSIHD